SKASAMRARAVFSCGMTYSGRRCGCCERPAVATARELLVTLARMPRPTANDARSRRSLRRCWTLHRALVGVDDLAAGGEPDALPLLHVRDGALEIFDAQGLADDHRMQRNAHDTRLLAAVGVERIEL